MAIESPENRAALMAPRDENALLLQRMEDSSLRQLWRLTNILIKVRNGALTQKDVKNEGRSDYVNENKGEIEKIDENPSRFSAENARIRR